jgi:hypothetical protein
MSKKKRKSTKRSRPEEAELHLVKLDKPAPRRPSRKGEFLWGLAFGLLGALAVVLVLDHTGFSGIPSSERGRPGADGGGGEPASRSLVLAGFLPRGSSVFVDGEAVDAETTDMGVRLEIEPSAQRLEVRGSNGPWWTTNLAVPATDADTLRPVLSGDLVVEVDKQGPTGELFVDGVRKGVAPGSAGDVPPGWHLVSIRSPQGDILFENGIEITPGDVSVLRVPPVPPRGKAGLVVRARRLSDEGLIDAPGAAVFVDGKQEGVTPLELTLPAGHHSIRVETSPGAASVEAVFLEAGRSRYVDAQFGGEDHLEVEVSPPLRAPAGSPVAVPVAVAREGKAVILREGALQMIRAGQSETIPVPLVPSTSDPGVWVAVLPAALAAEGGELTGFATCIDEGGRTGTSELFRIPIR